MEKAVTGLAGGIAACGGKAVILCESDADYTIEAPAGYLIRSFRKDDNAKPWSVAMSLRRYMEKELNSDSTVVLHSVFHPGVAGMARLLRAKHIPYVVAPHCPYHSSLFLKNAHRKWPYWYLVERPMLRGAAAVQVLDRRQGVLLRELGVKTSVIEVINGYRESDVIPESDISFRKHGTARLLFLGRIESIQKGLDLLLEAFDIVAEVADAELTIQGPDRGDLAALKAQASKSMHKQRIRFMPPDFGTSPVKTVAGYDVFVITSRFEGFSLAAMEAMIAARPLVISDNAGLAPHVRAAGCGEVVEANVASIRDGILSVLKRKDEWGQMGMAGRRYALERFQWKRIAGEAMEEYAKIKGGFL